MCANRCKVHINIRKTTCLSFSPSFVAKHETFLFFSHRPKPSISETCVLGHKQGKIRQKLETPLSFCSRHPITLKLCTCQYKPIIHCLQHLWCLEYHIFYFKVSVCDFRGFDLVLSLAHTRTCQALLFLRFQHSKFLYLQSRSYQPQRMWFIPRIMCISLVYRLTVSSLFYRRFFFSASPNLRFGHFLGQNCFFNFVGQRLHQY